MTDSDSAATLKRIADGLLAIGNDEGYPAWLTSKSDFLLLASQSVRSAAEALERETARADLCAAGVVEAQAAIVALSKQLAEADAANEYQWRQYDPAGDNTLFEQWVAQSRRRHASRAEQERKA